MVYSINLIDNWVSIYTVNEISLFYKLYVDINYSLSQWFSNCSLWHVWVPHCPQPEVGAPRYSFVLWAAAPRDVWEYVSLCILKIVSAIPINTVSGKIDTITVSESSPTPLRYTDSYNKNNCSLIIIVRCVQCFHRCSAMVSWWNII